MCILCVNTLLKVIGYYHLSALSMSVKCPIKGFLEFFNFRFIGTVLSQ